ncbi:unnamed protein product, partial [Citrullus colocynthis]
GKATEVCLKHWGSEICGLSVIVGRRESFAVRPSIMVVQVVWLSLMVRYRSSGRRSPVFVLSWVIRADWVEGRHSVAKVGGARGGGERERKKEGRRA